MDMFLSWIGGNHKKAMFQGPIEEKETQWESNAIRVNHPWMSCVLDDKICANTLHA